MASFAVFLVALLSTVAAVSGATPFAELTDALLLKGFKNIVEEIAKTGVDKELESYLNSGNKATLFLPRDNYFPKNVDAVTLKYLESSSAELSRVLKFHVVPGKLLTKADLSGSFGTLEGTPITISIKDKKLFVEQSPIRTPNAIIQGNVIVHGINGLLIPPALKPDLPVSPPRRRVPRSPPAPVPAPAPGPAPGPSEVLAPGPSPATSEILDALRRANYNSLVTIITELDLVGYVNSLSAPVTILAPNDAALNVSLTPAQAMAQNVSFVTRILDNHIISGQYLLYGFLNGNSVQYPSKAGSTIFFRTQGASSVNVGLTDKPDIRIVSEDILSDDVKRISVLGINGVILPPPSPQPGSGIHWAPSLLLTIACGLAFALL